MNKKIFLRKILPRLIQYRFNRLGLLKSCRPITLTHSVTFACQSRCKTCNIGHQYLSNPDIAKNDLSLDEIEKIYKNIGPVYFYNISGGEPFLRNDLPQIVELAMKYLKPNIVHSPTNAILSEKIRDKVIDVLEVIKKYDPDVPFTVKPSIDGVGEKHDEIRGVKGNFKRLVKTLSLLKEVEKEYPNFHLELGTVVSVFNINDLSEIEDYVHTLGIQSYRNEIAESREEFFNVDEKITPAAEVYETLMKDFKRKITENIKNKKSLAKMTEAIRLVYYDLVPEILKQKKQIIPCYAGVSNIHLNHNGELWPCCVLGYSKPMGNFGDKDINYDYTRLMKGVKAQKVLKSIKDKECYCPLANQSYSNILLNIPSLIKTVSNIIKFKF